jgi:adenosylmethionine-8-amino-7-oxononanoate aminotransferase
VSVGGIDLFHSIYHPLLFDTLKAEPGDAGHLERLLAAHRGEVAAVIMEPLVQGAAGMLVHPEGYLRSVRELCDRYDTLLILDEVATGCGRTFACEHEEVAPDLMCLAKGISGGYLPLAATLASERVYEGVLGKHEEFRTFFHGHTYTGNPLACAAAIASLDVFSEEETLARLQPKLDLLGGLLEPIAAQPETLPGERRARPCAWRRCAGAPARLPPRGRASPRTSRSPSSERRRQGRTSRPGCPRTGFRTGCRRRDRPPRGHR